MHDLIGPRWPVKFDSLGIALRVEDARGRELEDPTEQRAGFRVLADAFDYPKAVALVAVPVDLHPHSLIRGRLENRAEVAETLENPRVPVYIEVRPEDAVPPEDRKELFLRCRE
jgi:hypothetical protein